LMASRCSTIGCIKRASTGLRRRDITGVGA
jgi:hypothetical protein